MVWGGIFAGTALQIQAAWRRKVADILRLPLIDKISFVLADDAIEVSPRKLRQVADAIEKGRIDVVVADTGPQLAAAYSPHSNKMTLRNAQVPDSGLGRSDIVHESVHALVDMFRYTQATALSDEVAAYLAQAIFMRSIGLRVTGGEAKPIFDAALAIIDAHQLGKVSQVRLRWADYLQLREAVHANPAYSGIGDRELTSGHGVPD
jgi:hypothetical protein